MKVEKLGGTGSRRKERIIKAMKSRVLILASPRGYLSAVYASDWHNRKAGDYRRKVKHYVKQS
jgi:hypothetical protein